MLVRWITTFMMCVADYEYEEPLPTLIEANHFRHVAWNAPPPSAATMTARDRSALAVCQFIGAVEKSLRVRFQRFCQS